MEISVWDMMPWKQNLKCNISAHVYYDILSLQIINELANYVNKEAFYYMWTYSTDKNVPVQVK